MRDLVRSIVKIFWILIFSAPFQLDAEITVINKEKNIPKMDMVFLDYFTKMVNIFSDQNKEIWKVLNQKEIGFLFFRESGYTCLIRPLKTKSINYLKKNFKSSKLQNYNKPVCNQSNDKFNFYYSFINYKKEKFFAFNLTLLDNFIDEKRQDNHRLNPYLKTSLTVFHEFFHTQINPRNSHNLNFKNAYLEYLKTENLALLMAELDLLDELFLEPKKTKLLEKFVSLRKYREKKYPNSFLLENETETLEGAASYFELKSLSSDSQYFQEISPYINFRRESLNKNFYNLVRGKNYFSGLVLFLILEKTNQKITKNLFLNFPMSQITKKFEMPHLRINLNIKALKNTEKYFKNELIAKKLISDHLEDIQKVAIFNDQSKIKIIIPFPDNFIPKNRIILPNDSWLANYSFKTQFGNYFFNQENDHLLGVDFAGSLMQILPSSGKLFLDGKEISYFPESSNLYKFKKEFLVKGNHFKFQVSEASGEIQKVGENVFIFMPNSNEKTYSKIYYFSKKFEDRDFIKKTIRKDFLIY